MEGKLYHEWNAIGVNGIRANRKSGVPLTLPAGEQKQRDADIPQIHGATGIKTFTLETPIVLKLACRGSRSTINYGMNAKIKFSHTWHDKYFDITNIEYYGAILGTPFLRKHNIEMNKSSRIKQTMPGL